MSVREIKFRGMNIKGNWYYGLLAIVDYKNNHGIPKNGSYISNSCGMAYAYEVRPETVGQYTDFTDIEGKEVFEGDKVQLFFEEYNDETDEFMIIGEDILEVKWNEEVGHIGVVYDYDDAELWTLTCLKEWLENGERDFVGIKIIGNKHETKEEGNGK
jgi:hypothetical protein